MHYYRDAKNHYKAYDSQFCFMLSHNSLPLLIVYINLCHSSTFVPGPYNQVMLFRRRI
jgi:hypothetical protein